ncbi:transaldolase [Cystoisospora suis]|uniref:Transaldolase n=1 Tax=Cystoisospora suis TaxID=483139 RepID=A0A2C6KHD1_9APIC|nr:transaldolase [Cystoisospora suis]
MAASFRNIGEIIALAGCDKVTVSPALLEELKTCHDSVTRRLFPDGKEEEGENKEKKHKETNGSASSSVSEEKTASSANGMMAKNPDAVEDDLQKKKLKIDEKTFRWMLNEDPMATEKLAEGIRGFNKDLLSLKALVREKLKL